ncbi:stabilizer of axonemal microtubules 2-like [Lytechinus variegatus]|uniref:stabilizer of axonemal microtubules 2-like n=1 Tax=Lytechinus variegatus TaxID=7654 RepID=UPI001BB17909|nr:stabilizer of axonemal microtubules 2-like [Lytechinus variegatus]
MTKRCICEICTCGRHRCPHRPKGPQKANGPCTISEYSNKYKAYPGNGMRENFKPKAQMLKSGDPISDATTNRLDYIPHEVERPAMHVPEQFKPKEGDIDLLTSYTKDYPHRKAQPAKSYRGNQTRAVSPGAFKGTPTYVDDYRKWNLPPKEQLKDHHAYIPPNAAFDGLSTFTRDFPAKRAAMRQSMKPNDEAKVSTTPFDDKTSHRMTYIPHAAQPKFVPTKPQYKKNPHKFEGLSTFQRDFNAKQGYVPESCKPSNTPLRSDQPFDDNTTFRQSYQKWDLARPYQHVPEAWVKPGGQIDLNTTHNLAFPAHKVQPALPVRPHSGRHGQNVPFDDRTQYNQDFKKWNSVPTRRGDPSQRPYERPSVPFEGMSHYQTNYLAKHAHPAKSMAPDNVANLSSEPFDDRTNYKAEYIPKEFSPCPAIDLKKSGFQYADVDNRGHQIWLKNQTNGSMQTMQKTPPQQLNIDQPTLA